MADAGDGDLEIEPVGLEERVIRGTSRWRHWVLVVAFLAAVGMILAGLALSSRTVPRDEATVVLLVDVSGSMVADDVAPDRMTAARRAANAFVQSLPSALRVAVVSFASTVNVVASPTADRAEVAAAIDGLTAGGGLGVPIYTIALGTEGGQALIPDGRSGTRLQSVPPDLETLRSVADRTQGRFYGAPSAERLDAVYRDIGSKVGYRKVTTRWPLVLGVSLLLLAAGLSLAWRREL